jgi:CheY-like chemotaxis protein
MSDKFNKILYVEDYVDLQEIVAICLKELGGHDVKICSSGKEVFEEIDEFHPDLLLFDIMLPDITGPDILKQLRANPKYKDTPAIFISAKFIGHELTEYRKLGVLGIIRKPFDPTTLLQVIEAMYKGDKTLLPEAEERAYKFL